MEDRDYQSKAETAIVTELENGCHQQLVSMATGTGKTVVFARLPEKLAPILSGQTLVLAHREELIDQAIDKMQAANPTLKIDKEKAEHKADPSTADVIVASVATLGRKGTKRVEKYNWNYVDKIITDEAHHSVADSYRNIYNLAGVLEPNTNKLLIGFTATPSRADGKALSSIYKKISYIYSMRQAMQDGWLVDVRGYRISTKVQLDNVKTSGGDFNIESLAETIDRPERNKQIVTAWQELAQGRSTVAFTASIEHAVNLAKTFQEAGIEAEAVWGDDPDREAKIERHKTGETLVLCNCNLFVEGYDDWRIGCIIIARPTKSSVLFTQMVGRGTRLQEGTGNLLQYIKSDGIGNIPDALGSIGIKSDCIVIDVVDATSKHSLITLPTLLGLHPELDLNGKSVLWAAKTIEEAQEAYENIDFTKLSSIDALKAFIEKIDMFEVRFPEEVESNSEMRWFKAIDGGYRLNVPKSKDGNFGRGEVRIYKNMLDKWEISGYIKNRAFKGTRASIEEAFAAADQQVRERAQDSLTLVKRTASWHDKPCTPQQFGLLKRLYPQQQWPADLTKGMASLWIDKKIGRKA